MSQVILTEGAAPSTPSTGKVTIYAKTDGTLFIKDDAGTETQLAAVVEAHGVMSVQANASAEATTDATPRKVTAFDTDGLESNMTVDSTTGNDITADVAGTYFVFAQTSFGGTASKTYHITIYKNGATTGFEGHRKLGTGGDVGSASVSGIVALAATDTISIYHHTSDGGTAFTLDDGQLVAVRLSA